MPASAMRIAVVTRHLGRLGGVESYLERLLPLLCEQGFDVRFFAAVASGEPGRISDGIDPERVRLLAGGTGLVDALAAFNPALVYAHGWTRPDEERRTVERFPAVLFLHDYEGLCISGSRSHRRWGNAICSRALGSGCLGVYHARGCGGRSPVTMLRQFVRMSYRHETIRRASAVVCASSFVAAVALQAGVVGERIHRVGLLIPRSEAPSPQPGRTPIEARLSLIFAGRHESLKGGDLLIDAASLLARRSDRSILVTLAGDGGRTSDWKQSARAAELSSSGRLRFEFPGRLEPSALGAAYATSHALIIPSVWPEPFGLVGLEAARHATPTVAFDVGGISEWLDTRAGVLVEPGRASALADGIESATRDAKRWQELSDAARLLPARWPDERHMKSLLAVLDAERRTV